MCIVTYTPLQDGFVFTSSRDESVHRQTGEPNFHIHGNNVLYYAKDLSKGGTWFAVDISKKKLCCLLNAAQGAVQHGAFSSRGNLPIHMLSNTTSNNDFNYLPHILITLNFNSPPSLKQTYWNSVINKSFTPSVEKMHLWASDNLYEQKDILDFRKDWESLIHPSVEETIQFHNACAQPLNSPIYKKKKANIMTVSTTTVVKDQSRFELHYHNRITNTSTLLDINMLSQTAPGD